MFRVPCFVNTGERGMHNVAQAAATADIWAFLFYVYM